MPIRPENRERYPADWRKISDRIRFVRAAGRCECRGECGEDHGGQCDALNYQPHPITGSRVVLTTAHLPGREIEQCGDDDLRAMCQRCHLRMDRELHAKTRRISAARTRAARAVGDLFEEAEDA